jgi:uncharacterized protein (TIGR02145 family)
MLDNLNADYKDGSSFCYRDNVENCKTFGRLYNAVAFAQGGLKTLDNASPLCPENWHIATFDDYEKAVPGYTGDYVPAESLALKDGGHSGVKDGIRVFAELGYKGYYGDKDYKYGPASYRLLVSRQDIASFEEFTPDVIASDPNYDYDAAVYLRCVKDQLIPSAQTISPDDPCAGTTKPQYCYYKWTDCVPEAGVCTPTTSGVTQKCGIVEGNCNQSCGTCPTTHVCNSNHDCVNNDPERVSDIQSIKKALDDFYKDHGYYPMNPSMLNGN